MAGGIAEGMTAGTAAGNAIANRLEAIRRRPMTDDLDRANLRQSQVLYGQAATGGQPETKGVVERAQDVIENTPENRWNMSLLQRTIQAPMTLASLKNNVKELEPVINPVLDDLTSANIKTRGDLRTRLFQVVQTPQFTEARMNILERASKLMDQGKRTEATKLMQFYNSTGPDGITDLIDTVMGKPRELIEQDRLARAQIEAKSQGGDQVQKAYYRPDGSIGYLGNKETPPAGWVPYSPEYSINVGDVSIKQGGNPYVQKRLPSGEVSKLSEMGAYQQTIGEIENIIGGAKADKRSLSGPFEVVNKIIDDWDVLGAGKENRIALRNLVARLPGVMYAMRGKQLSDKELQVALEMMPKMTQDDKAFVITLRNFSNYMNDLVTGKLGAFNANGYRAPSGMMKGANSKAVGKLVQEPSTMNPSQMTDEQLMEEAKRLGIR